jgi:alkylresorcinol/alkylpyrone synthase
MRTMRRAAVDRIRIASAATVFPHHYYSQDELLAALKRQWGDRLQNDAGLERLHRRCRVDGRHLALPIEAYNSLQSWGQANDTWIDVAQELGARAITEALGKAGLTSRDVGTLVSTSVTGIASPSIDARLIERLGLPCNVRRVPLFGLGCVGGAAGLARAADLVRAEPGQVAILLAVELCSLTWQREDVSVANIIATGLFGDGAAAVVVTGRDLSPAGPRMVAAESVFYPGTEDAMGWHISERGFRIKLSPDVPMVVRAHLGRDVDRFLSYRGLGRQDITTWIVHPGGPKVLEAARDALALSDAAVGASWDCLRRVGNLSSASVLMVLEEFMERRRPPTGTWSVLVAMGPGFCAEMVLLRW